MSAHILHRVEAALTISWQTDRLLDAILVFFIGKYALSGLLTSVLSVRSWAGRAVLANVGSNINNTINARGKRKPQPSLSTVAEPVTDIQNEDTDDEVTTSLCGIQGQTLLHCCHQLQLHSATIVVCIYGVSMHNMLAYMGLQVLAASTKANMCAFAGI